VFLTHVSHKHAFPPFERRRSSDGFLRLITFRIATIEKDQARLRHKPERPTKIVDSFTTVQEPENAHLEHSEIATLCPYPQLFQKLASRIRGKTLPLPPKSLEYGSDAARNPN
jgi:hypothetical protein